MLKTKLKKSQIFDTSFNIHFWLMNIENNIHKNHITTETDKIIYAISYLVFIIWQRIQCLQLKQDNHVQSWSVLKVWLKNNYSCLNLTLEAELKLHNLHMQTNQSIIKFITEFEIIILNLNWNNAAVSSAFQQCLFSEIVQQIHNVYFNSWSKTFIIWQKAAIWAASHIKVDHQLFNTERQSWRVQFEKRNNIRYHFQDCSQKRIICIKKNSDISDNKFWRHYHNNVCTWCSNLDHWHCNCFDAQNLMSLSFRNTDHVFRSDTFKLKFNYSNIKVCMMCFQSSQCDIKSHTASSDDSSSKTKKEVTCY